MSSSKHLVIVAGEESGDFHAATLVKKLKESEPALTYSGIGGRHLEAAGVTLISDLARFGVTGIVEIIRHAKVLRKAYKAIKAHLIAQKPDLLILVDYPGFNLRLAKFAKQKLGVRILYYISPQIWAWKAKRIELIRANIDRMAVIFPFEKTIYENAAIPVSFVGHPLANTLTPHVNLLALRQQLGLPVAKKLIAMLPGSRYNEIMRHMPVLLQTAEALSRQHLGLHFVIPISGNLNPDLVKRYFVNSKVDITFLCGKAIPVIACSNCVVVASGTASLECALLAKPMCIIYKTSLLTFMAASKLIKVNYLGLCNLLFNAMVVPELLQYDCNVQELTRVISALLTDEAWSKTMITRLNQLQKLLSLQKADCSIDALIKAELTTN